MTIKKGLIVLLLLAGLGGMFYYFSRPTSGETIIEQANDDSVTISLWYTDEAIGDYLNSAAVAFHDKYDIRIVPELHSGLEYLEEIHDASVKEDAGPDLYICDTSMIEKSAMLGLAIPVEDGRNSLSLMNYPKVSIDSITYSGQKFGYPFYYETAFLLYNETYLRQIAEDALRDEILNGDSDEEDDEEDMQDGSEENATGPLEGYTEDQWNQMIVRKTEEMIPSSIEDILNMANKYSAPEGAENYFVWDVSDIFYNYFFTGDYMNVGGEYGDDPSIIQIYNEDTVKCMQVYQNLNQFFSIDSKTSSYEQVLDDFIQGKTIFTIATTDALAKIDQAKYEGTFTWDYSVSSLPGVDAEHDAKGLSTTSALIVNGYTKHRKEADAFAAFVSNDYIDSFFTRTGKLAASNGSNDYVIDATDLARDMYRESVPNPKLIGLSNFWVELELAYVRIWEGQDPESILSELQATMEKQLN